MELYICRSGAIEGPYPLGQLETMLQQGQLLPTDLAAPPGAGDWSPLSELMAVPPATAPPRVTAPPPLRTGPDPRVLDQQFTIGGRIPAGTAGKSVRDVVSGVTAGGRLVVFQYVFSLLVISFRRNTPIHYLPPGSTGVGPAFRWSLIPLCFGWWGIPWGIIFTIGAVWRNTAGGVDVTEPILAQLIGPAKADLVVRSRPQPPKGALWGLRAMILALPLLFPLLIIPLALSDSHAAKERSKQPGYRPFKEAEHFVGLGRGTTGQGNTRAATTAAEQFSSLLKNFRTTAITGDSATGDDLVTWCETHDRRCLFIVEVAGLRHFSSDAKTALGKAAWCSAQIAAANLGLPANADLVVAIRGSLLYDRAIVGNLLPDFNPKAADAESLLERSILATKTGHSIESNLIRYFVSEPAPGEIQRSSQ